AAARPRPRGATSGSGALELHQGVPPGAARADVAPARELRGIPGTAARAGPPLGAPAALADGPARPPGAALRRGTAHRFAFFFAGGFFSGAGFGATWSTIFWASMPKALKSFAMPCTRQWLRSPRRVIHARRRTMSSAVRPTGTRSRIAFFVP